MSFPATPFFSEDSGSDPKEVGEKRRVLDMMLDETSGAAGTSSYHALTPTAPWTGVSSFQEPAYVKFGQIIFLMGIVVVSSGTVNNGSVIATIPASPLARPGAIVPLESGGWEFQVATNGQITYEGRDGYSGRIILAGSWRLNGVAA